MNTFINYAALRNNTQIGKKVFVQGYEELGDGGEGIFYWDNNNVAADNDGTIIKVDLISTGRWVRLFDNAVNVKWFGAKADGSTSDHAAIQRAIDANALVFFPEGVYKITTSITLQDRSHVYGVVASSTIIDAHGCDCFIINAPHGDNVTIENMHIRSLSEGGSPDPKTNIAIKSLGANLAHVSYLVVRGVFLQGFLYSIDLRYTWNSVIDNIITSNCQYGVRLFGQSVNNSINNCTLQANSGEASVYCVADGSITSEGLMICNSLLSSGNYGIVVSSSFLALMVSNCVIDQIQNKGIYVTDAKSTLISNCWISAKYVGIEFNELGQVAEEFVGINNCRVEITEPLGLGIKINGQNKGFTITGGSISVREGQKCIYVYYAQSIAISNLFLFNESSTAPSVVIESSQDVATSMLVGNSIVQTI